MSSSCNSPFRFHGLPWESWTNALGRTTPLEDKPPESKQQEKNKPGVMKLPKEDMKIFGLCPERDPFTVVVCEKCNMCVKPQAFLHHNEMRHMNKDIHPPLPNLSEVAVHEKVTAKVVKTIVKTPPAKAKTKKVTNKDSLKGKEGIVTPTPSLPVSLTLEAHLPDHTTSKGETLQPVVALTPLVGTPLSPATPILSKPAVQTPPLAPPVLGKGRRPPRKHAPIKEREYDPDKHCGVVTTETMKPCTWSLTCKSHPMSLRRAVMGRSKPFDQLLADHRQAKEALLKQKKNVEMHNSSVMTTTLSQPEPKLQAPSEKLCIIEPVTTLLFRLPELSLDVTPTKQIYLSSPPQSLVVKSSERPNPTLPQNPPTQLDVVAYTLNHPKALNASPMFSNHKIGGLVYTNRRMQIARQGLESCLYRAGNGIYMATQGREFYTLPLSGTPSTLNGVLSNITSRAAKGLKQSKSDKPSKPNKKVCLSKEATNLINLQINNLKSVLSRQYPNTTNRLSVPSATNTQFHIPNILSNALKRSAETPSKTQNKKFKKKNSTIIGSVLSNHSKNGLVPSKPSVPYVRVAIANAKVDSDSKTLGLCETAKFSNSNKILNESDLRKIGLRFEIFE